MAGSGSGGGTGFGAGLGAACLEAVDLVGAADAGGGEFGAAGDAPGMSIGDLHLGHFTFLPAAASGAVIRDEQPGHNTVIGIG